MIYTIEHIRSLNLGMYKQSEYLADPGKARGCSINSLVTDWLIQSVSKLAFSSQALRRLHAKTVRDRCSSYKIDYVIVIKNFLNPEGHQNPISGSKVTAILLKGWILLVYRASAREGLPCSLRNRLVTMYSKSTAHIRSNGSHFLTARVVVYWTYKDSKFGYGRTKLMVTM